MEFSNLMSAQFTSMLNGNPDLESWLDFAFKETVETTPEVSDEDRFIAIMGACLGVNGKD